MSSMTRVMEKVLGGPAGAPASGGADAGRPPPEETRDDADAAAAGVAASGDAPSGFVAAPPVDDGPLPADGRTVEWDARRVDPVIIAFHDRFTGICEQYRAIRARLLTMNTARAHQVIAITSSVPEEGKSVSTLNLGLIMAEGGEHRILIADADFRRTSLARMVGIAPRPGLADVLSGEATLADAVQPSPLPNLHILPAGEVRNAAYGELLSATGTAAVVAALRARYDYVFLDTPPVTTVSDVCLLAPNTDGALLVIEMRRTPEPTVQIAVRSLQANNVRILGCILSRFCEHSGRYYDHYYSYYYGRR